MTRAHIRTFVTEFSRDLGAAGREAIQRLVERAAARLGKDYIVAAVEAGAAYQIGHGHGPVHHFHRWWQ